MFDAQIAEHKVAVTPPESPEPPAPPPAQAVGPTPDADAQPLTWAAAVALLDTIPGINRRMAELLLAEIGADMRRFPTAAHLASWAKLAPGNNESAGKHYSGATGHGNRWLRSGLVQAAWAAVKVKTSYLVSCYHRLAGRRDAKRAIIAVAHRMLTAIYYMLTQHEPYRDLGATYLDERHKVALIKRTERRFKTSVIASSSNRSSRSPPSR